MNKNTINNKSTILFLTDLYLNSNRSIDNLLKNITINNNKNNNNNIINFNIEDNLFNINNKYYQTEGTYQIKSIDDTLNNIKFDINLFEVIILVWDGLSNAVLEVITYLYKIKLLKRTFKTYLNC